MSQNLTLVHTMGRVGSTSVFHALEKAGLDVRHIHHVNPRTLKRLPRARHVTDGLEAARLLRADPDLPVDIVTLVRDPVDRNVSAAFARFRRHGDPDELARLVTDRRTTRQAWKGVDGDLPARWFDEEVREPTGIDVYAAPFGDDGIALFEADRYRLLVMSSRLDPDAQTGALERFVGREVRVRRNDSATRSGGGLHEVYARFARTCPWSRGDLAAMLSSRYARHFFGAESGGPARVEEAARRLGIG